jgi:5-hydroxyisourate hydrolase
MNTLSTHVLDTSLGKPAVGVHVTLARVDGGEVVIGTATTDLNGRASNLVPPEQVLSSGTYRLRFDVDGYMARAGRPAFFPAVIVVFVVGSGDEHYHIPLLLSPFGYTTYRGS